MQFVPDAKLTVYLVPGLAWLKIKKDCILTWYRFVSKPGCAIYLFSVPSFANFLLLYVVRLRKFDVNKRTVTTHSYNLL